MKLTETTFLQFQKLLVHECGLFFSKDRSDILAEKVWERAKACGFHTCEKYLHHIRFDPQGKSEIVSLIDHLTINETYFFRNGPQFTALKDFILPGLIEKKRSESNLGMIKIWSAGCSTGDEPYSLAILLREALPDPKGMVLSILATDINRTVLEKAAGGVYGQRSVQEVPAHILHRHFTRSGSHYRLKDDIRNMVQFHHHNLVSDPYTLLGMQGVDIIFCRNVIIYFNAETIKGVIAQFRDCLQPEGYLFMGHAEALWEVTKDFKAVEFPQTFLYRKVPAGTALRPLPEAAPSPPPILLPNVLPQDQRPKVPEWQPAFAPSLDEMMSEATALANRGEYRQAMKTLKYVVARDNLHTAGHYLLGVLFAKEKQYDQAVEEFRRLLFIDDRVSVAYFHLGDLYRFLGKRKEAKKEYDNCLRILKKTKEDEPVPFSAGLTAGVLCQATYRALNALEG